MSERTMYMLAAPLIIGARLLPAVRLDDGSTVSIEVTRRDNDDRVVTRCYIDAADGSELYASEGVRSGCGADVDVRALMGATLAFLEAEAETYAYGADMGTREPSDGWLFNAAVAEWAYMHDDELSMARCELEGDDQ